ncbi:hypothetical protein [Kitasatospora sp. NPDC088134]|uniref:hypothetical protein n=1 Tax=Kitasatospora sp. NPDC088134 TaxID=3364071 RepID=UPI0037FFA776
MTDLPGPQPSVVDLSTLIPAVVPVDGADPELVAIGERYWALAGFADEYGTPVWCEKTKDIDVAGWGRQIYAVAAAGVRAVVPGQQCPKCDGPLSLTSRTAFQQVCDGVDPACVECTDSLQAAIRLVIDPTRKAKREAAKAQAQAQQVVTDARAQWQRSQQDVIENRYPAVFPSDGDALPGASVRQMVATLALLRYAPSTSPISDVDSWPDPLHPDMDKAVSLLGELVRARLVKIHPSSPIKAFEWVPAAFEDALREADRDLEALATPQVTGSFYPTLARYFAPYGTSAATAVEQLDARLAEALAPAALTSGRQDDLLALARELIADEALRYFHNRVDELYLPTVPDNHTARLEQAAFKVAEHRTLGEIYNLVWRSTRAAAEAAQKNPRAPRANMTTHAVNRFESHAQRAAAEPSWDIKAFDEIQGHGPAAMTRTLFYAILDSNPVDTSLPELRAALPAPASAGYPSLSCGDDELAVLIEWLNANPDTWDPADVPAALATLKGMRGDSAQLRFEGLIVARGARHLYRLHERLAPTIGARQAALAVLAATAMLVHPLTAPGASTSGEWLLHQLGRLLRDWQDHTDDDRGTHDEDGAEGRDDPGEQ